jgi:hypothetical protein
VAGLVRSANSAATVEYDLYLANAPDVVPSPHIDKLPDMLRLVSGNGESGLAVLCQVCGSFSSKTNRPVAVKRCSMSNFNERHMQTKEHKDSVLRWQCRVVLPRSTEAEALECASEQPSVAQVHRAIVHEKLPCLFKNNCILNGPKDEYDTLEYNAVLGTVRCVDKKCAHTFCSSTEVYKNPYNLLRCINQHFNAKNSRLLKDKAKNKPPGPLQSAKSGHASLFGGSVAFGSSSSADRARCLNGTQFSR